MYDVSSASVKKFMGGYESLKRFKEKTVERGQEMAQTAFATGLTLGMGAAAGYAQGRYSDIDPATGKPSKDDKFHVGTLPIPVLAGAGALLASLVGLAGKYDTLVAAAGVGALEGPVVIGSYKMGRVAKATENKMPITETYLPEAPAASTAGRFYARGAPAGGVNTDAVVANAVRASMAR